jgi:hypothetical protein
MLGNRAVLKTPETYPPWVLVSRQRPIQFCDPTTPLSHHPEKGGNDAGGTQASPTFFLNGAFPE